MYPKRTKNSLRVITDDTRCTPPTACSLVPLAVGGAVDALHHGQTGRMNAGVLLGGLLLLLTLSILLVEALLLLLACTLLHLELGALLAVAGALVVQFLVLGMDALPTDLAVATTASTSNSLVSNTTRIHGEKGVL
jgi:hypothetical protein